MKYHRCNACIVGKGVRHGWRLTFKYHKDIIKDNHSRVPVLVWRMPENDIKELELYYGYPHYYMSTIVDINIQNRKQNERVYMRHEDINEETE